MEAISINTENSKTNELHRFKLDLPDKLNPKNPNKNMALVKLSIYYTWKNIKSKYNNNKFKISDPTWPHSLTMMNAVNTEFSFGEVWFTDQTSKALEIKDNVNLTLIIGQIL